MRRNHAVHALFAIARAAGREPDVALHVDKHIPVGAGLGGGSADAAATLLAVNTLWGLHWPIERLRDIAATLGADMPFCLRADMRMAPVSASGSSRWRMIHRAFRRCETADSPANCWWERTMRN